MYIICYNLEKEEKKMKKLRFVFALCFVLLFVPVFTTACDVKDGTKKFFDESTLEEFGIPDLPVPEKANYDFDENDGTAVKIDSRVSLQDYFKTVLEYCVSKNFNNFGTLKKLSGYSEVFSPLKNKSTNIEDYCFDEFNDEYAIVYSSDFIRVEDSRLFLNNAHVISVYSYPKHNSKYDYIIKLESKNIFIDPSVETTRLNTVLGIGSISYDEVQKVRYEHGALGIAPGFLVNVEYSTAQIDKSALLMFLNTPLYEITDNSWLVCGGGYVRYSITTKDDIIDIYINNRFISLNDKHYLMTGDYVEFKESDLKANKFVTYQDEYDVYVNDVKVDSQKGVSEFEFVVYDGEAPTNDALGYLDTEFGKMYVYSENVFSLEREDQKKFYLLVGDKDFSFLNDFIK